MMREELIEYLWRSGLVRQSVDRLLPDLGRWERLLREEGVKSVPKLPTRNWSHEESHAHNVLNLLIKQSSLGRDKSSEHRLRNLTRIRPYKS
jgi:hypothetical protein